MSVLSTVCSRRHPAVAVGIHSSVAVDTALTSRQSVISNQTAAMAQRRVILHVLNTTGIVLAFVIRLYQHFSCKSKLIALFPPPPPSPRPPKL